MKKLHTSLLVLALVPGATANATVYLGAGVGYAHAGGKISGVAANGSSPFNKNARGHGGIADVHAGHYVHLDPKWFTSQQLAVSLDTPRAEASTAPSKKLSLDRLYNIAGTVGLGYKFDPVWDAYGKVGVANGALRFKDKASPNVSYERTKNLWGVIVGGGVNKILSTYTVGLDYEYTRYQGTKYAYQSTSGLQYDTSLKRPAYHAVTFKFSKAF